MRVDLGQWTEAAGWRFRSPAGDPAAVQLVLYFASPALCHDISWWQALRTAYPSAKLVGCTTGGEILGSDVYDGTVVVAAIGFARARVDLRAVAIEDCATSLEVGRRLGDGLPPQGLRGVFVLSDGTRVNGSDLVRGLKEVLPDGAILTGGLAGDGDAFRSTLVGADGVPAAGMVCAIGFYGDDLNIRHGSFGGWDAFGPERHVTRSSGNVLYELDGEPALDLYKRYLGDEAANLPGSALLFPLRVRSDEAGSEVVRTVIGVDEERRGMIFAGDVPEGAVAQLMRGNFEHLVEGAGKAARQAATAERDGLAILVSCIGRKLLMGQRVAEEVEAAGEVFGAAFPAIGFYSYGEISPHDFTGSCELHNQTMTITVLGETIRA